MILVLVAMAVDTTEARFGVSSCASQATMGRRPSPYRIIKGKLQGMADALLGLPESGVWVHEKQLYKVIGATSGDKFGPRNCMSCLIDGIEKGYWWNINKKDDYTTLKQGALVRFSQETSEHKVV